MSIHLIMALIFVPVIILVTWVHIVLYQAREENWKNARSAPKYIIEPSYDLGYSISEKEFWPFPGGSPVVRYRPLFGHYTSLESAEAQLAHYLSKDGKSNG